MRSSNRLIGLLALAVLCAACALAQDQEIAEYERAFPTLVTIVYDVLASAAYLGLYAAALVIPLSYMQRLHGFDLTTLLWIGALWLGGMVANCIAYAITDIRLLAALLAMPLIYGWALLLGTRSWADLPMRNAKILALVVTLVCAPYFGPTWRLSM